MQITGTATQSNGLHNIDIARAAQMRIQADARITKQMYQVQHVSLIVRILWAIFGK